MVKRVHRTRQHKLPPNTKCVSRFSKFANPFFAKDGFICVKPNHKKHKYNQPLLIAPESKAETQKLLKEMYRDLINGKRKFGVVTLKSVGEDTEFPFEVYVPTKEEIKEELASYAHLACWCKLEYACHSDVLCDILSEMNTNK